MVAGPAGAGAAVNMGLGPSGRDWSVKSIQVKYHTVVGLRTGIGTYLEIWTLLLLPVLLLLVGFLPTRCCRDSGGDNLPVVLGRIVGRRNLSPSGGG